MPLEFQRQPHQLDLGLGLGELGDVGEQFAFWVLSAFRDVRSAEDLEIGGCTPMTSSRRRLQQPFRGGPRLGGDLRAGQHPRDFLAAVIGGERIDAGGDALALVERVL